MSNPRLPYRMPVDAVGKTAFLSELMSIPPTWLSFMDAHEACSLLSDVCLYRHLDRFTRPKVLARVQSLPGPKQSMIRDRIVLPLANPNWGLWTRTTEELLQQHEFLDGISKWGSRAGLGFSFAAGTRLITELRNAAVTTKTGAAAVATVGIWGFFWLNDTTRDQVREELFRRVAVH